MRIELKTNGIDSLVQEISDIVGNKPKRNASKHNSESTCAVKPIIQPDGNIALNVPIRIKHKNGRKLIITPENESNRESFDTEPTALDRRLAQAHHYLYLLESGEYPTITLLAEAHNQDPSKLTKILNLVNLLPAVQKMIVEGNTPQSMTLVKLYSGISADWEEQQKMFN